jgi:hypothetical protein
MTVIIRRNVCYFAAMQEAFDTDVKSGCITRDGWSNNATVDGRLGYKLIVQTGENDNPIDKRRVNKCDEYVSCFVFKYLASLYRI